MESPRIVGLDIGKSTLVAALDDGGQPRSFANAPTGHAQLVHWVHRQQAALVVLEATGGYHLGIWEALAGAGIPVAVGHPTRLRYWMQGQGQRAKTDQLDARLLARYGQQQHPAPTPLPSQTVRTIAAVLDRRGQLVKERTREKNRLQQAAPVVAESIRTHLAWLRTAIRDLERQLGRLLAPIASN
jgi:transposase